MLISLHYEFICYVIPSITVVKQEGWFFVTAICALGFFLSVMALDFFYKHILILTYEHNDADNMPNK